jgi:type II secretory pathway pseudopilin PulG
MRIKSEKGIALIETIAAVALLGIISASFLGGLSMTSTSRVTADERASAKILAETVMENVRKQPYATSYDYTVPDEYSGYTATINATKQRNNNIQIITITIHHRDKDVISLESYKVSR